uniref:DUF4442 domain-containing protein n=2 Tax=Entomoneis paludosa TaxID=265537 RepID=A0A7S2YNZ9_9STRA|mmetsp:Transcript_4111/g.8817  ORF Transcript_4111/g.8817 Transcript_4111/m.8817 type:complete len:188 (+) Transcript_4111:215-778(+)|eukprot:CAMPEP_0172458994 /NCGR_PEP_ID=MMETSP1065-20121228/30457_1 /TAXON_ID=265537 /ORGANISM="Amphiprora paludosa, Strain CCMP125" /LENGTH=187 /DNA_ID=CAMNT_0013213515 /DNA_START=161 /DNA_END=724 /DNA_ORIENTATION=-
MSLTKFNFSAKTVQRSLNWMFPPWMGAGIQLETLSDDFRRARVKMPLRPFFNRNYVGTHYGGSLYSMCDPMYMLQLLHVLGPDQFIVWDMAAQIRYQQPGKSTVYADFVIDEELVESLRALQPNEKKIVNLPVDVYSLVKDDNHTGEESRNDNKTIVASLIKTLYIKRKPEKDEQAESNDTPMQSKL